MFAICRPVLLAALVSAAALAPAAAAGNGAVERPAPQRPMPSGKPVALRPNPDLAATLNAIIAAQLAVQGEAQADQANPYRQPRPRPDREHLVQPAKAKG